MVSIIFDKFTLNISVIGFIPDKIEVQVGTHCLSKVDTIYNKSGY